MTLSGNYSLWFGDWHWNNNQHSHSVHRNSKMTQEWTEAKGGSFTSLLGCESLGRSTVRPTYWGHRKGKAEQRAFHCGSESPRQQPHLSYSAHAQAVRAPTKAAQCWGWQPSVLTGDFHSVPPLWWLWRVSVPSPQGHELLWVSVKLHCEEQRVAGALKHYCKKAAR